MKVYVLEGVWHYEGFKIIGLFTNKAAAEKAIAAHIEKGVRLFDEYDIEEFDLEV